MLKQLNLLLKLDCCRLLCALESSRFVEAVDCRLLSAVESSRFVEIVDSVVVEDVDCCRLHYVF